MDAEQQESMRRFHRERADILPGKSTYESTTATTDEPLGVTGSVFMFFLVLLCLGACAGVIYFLIYIAESI